MAKRVEIPLETYHRVNQQLNDATLLSLEDLSIASEAEWERTQEKHAHNSYLDPLAFVEGKDLVENLRWQSRTTGTERTVVTHYHEELTLREIGDVLD
jgi:DNA-directed RNA polymerase specialized sigma subunit